MFQLVRRLLLLLLVVLPTIILITENNAGPHILALAEDVVEGEDDEGQVETDDGDQGPAVVQTGEEVEEEEEKPLKPSPDADSTFLFVKPTGIDLPAAQVVDVLVGFTNIGGKDFVLDTLDASLRYPMDYSFTIQNFSVHHLNRVVKPKEQVTLAYSFMPSESFGSRPFGLLVSLNYHDVDGTPFHDAVYNETINIIEVEDGLDGEAIFLYVFLAACAVLLAVVGQQLLHSYGRKRPSKSKPIEMGTSNPNDVDFDWLPKETLLTEMRRKSPRQSPRQRRTKRSTGSDE